MDIIMISKHYVVEEVKSKTKAKMFENLQVGDVVQFSIPLKSAGRNRGTYASYIKCENVNSGEVSYNSFNQIGMRLGNFKLKEV